LILYNVRLIFYSAQLFPIVMSYSVFIYPFLMGAVTFAIDIVLLRDICAAIKQRAIASKRRKSSTIRPSAVIAAQRRSSTIQPSAVIATLNRSPHGNEATTSSVNEKLPAPSLASPVELR
jgi:hypothetical protein